MSLTIKAGTLAFLITLLSGPVVIPFLRRLKFGQYVRDDGPESHLTKAGTPTMGGIMFLAGTVGATLIFAAPEPVLLAALGITLGMGLVGFLDDFLKIIRKHSLGLKARQKLLAQFLLGLALAWFVLFYLGRDPQIAVPFLHQVYRLPAFLYGILVITAVMGTANAVNFTDGLDGLAAGATFFSFLAFMVIALTQGQNSLALFLACLATALVGFLAYNFHPARVFMGDTGSMALGGALAAAAVLTGTELYLVVIGGLYVVEVLSVIIQVVYFRRTGKRFFRMSPLHHHFELLGWPEKKVVLVFWVWSFLLAVIGLLDYLYGY